MKKEVWIPLAKDAKPPMRVVETTRPDGSKFVYAEWANGPRDAKPGERITEFWFREFSDGVQRFVSPLFYRSQQLGQQRNKTPD